MMAEKPEVPEKVFLLLEKDVPAEYIGKYIDGRLCTFWYKKRWTDDDIEYIRKSVADEKVRKIINMEIPSNWCDPLLTGKNKILKSKFDCNEIEQLLFAIKERLLKHFKSEG
jgi:predicted type IV restriction endonuclease